jgi:hypothetical protein
MRNSRPNNSKWIFFKSRKKCKIAEAILFFLNEKYFDDDFKCMDL